MKTTNATAPAYTTLQAISNDCEAWFNDEMDMTADDLLAAIKAAADAAIADTERA